MGRSVDRRDLGPLLHRAQPPRSLSLGRRPRREVGRHESPGGQLRAALDPARAQRSGPDDRTRSKASARGAARSFPRRRSRGSASRAAASPACKAATPGPASRVAVRSKAVIVATGGFNSNLDMVLRVQSRSQATTRCWKDRVEARPEPDTSSFAGPAAISRTWITSGSTCTPRPTTATPRSAAVSCSAWCPATSGSISRAAGSTTSRCRAATPQAPR